jgi:hypothetical protein
MTEEWSLFSMSKNVSRRDIAAPLADHYRHPLHNGFGLFC